jgi:tetratricopeptide (TPR) repeat protein
MNLGNIEAQKKDYQKAIDFYEFVISKSPHANPKDFKEKDETLFSKHLNSFNAYVDAHTNAAVMYVQLDQF